MFDLHHQQRAKLDKGGASREQQSGEEKRREEKRREKGKTIDKNKKEATETTLNDAKFIQKLLIVEHTPMMMSPVSIWCCSECSRRDNICAVDDGCITQNGHAGR
jgi:hypothetical protein